MEALDVLGDPVRRRILEMLSMNEEPAGAITAVIQDEFGISQPAVSQHLRVLRESGFAVVRADGTRRIYSLQQAPLIEIGEWLQGLWRFWDQRLDALDTELKRTKKHKQPEQSNQAKTKTKEQQ
jgi:DNA-binding transcriptional ArsR family regulator